MTKSPVRPASRAKTTFGRVAVKCIASAVGILSVSLTSVFATPPEPPPSLCVEESGHCASADTSGNIKWHPGHYVSFGGYFKSSTTMTSPMNLSARIAEINAMPSVRGIFLQFDWAAFESSEGVYNFGLVDQILAALASNKRLVIALAMFDAAGSVDSAVEKGIFPAYLRDTYAGIYLDQATSFAYAKVWTQPVMDRLIALHGAFAARYDTNPKFEGLSTVETVSVVSSSPDYSESAKLTQFKRAVAALEKQFPHTNVFIQADSGFALANRIDFLKYMIAHRMILSGPDIRTKDFMPSGRQGTQFQRTYQGLADDGGVDYRGQIACGLQIQANNMGGGHTPTAAELDPTTMMQFIYDHSQNPLRCSYLFWSYKDYGFSSDPGGFNNDIFWTSALSGWTFYHPTQKEFLSRKAGDIPVVTTPPKNYPGVDTN